MDNKERDVLKIASGDLPITKRPFDHWAATLNIGTDRLIDLIKGGIEKGFIRRFGAVLRHTKIGITHNAMVAWKVPEENCDRAGSIMARFSEVSHCYLRETIEDWPYNIYTMLHAGTEERLHSVIKEISETTGCNDYVILDSIKEFKKTSPNYFEGVGV